MEITSPEATRTIELVDIDFTLEGGTTLPVPLRPEDTVIYDDAEITLHFDNTGEEIIVNLNKVLWRSERKRQITEKTRPTEVQDETQRPLSHPNSGNLVVHCYNDSGP